jgi:hypothetical protein
MAVAMRTPFKPKDAFGSDLELFPAQMRDMNDMKRLTELNPMLQQAFAKPRSAEYLSVEELEDGSDQGGTRFLTHITTTVGTAYVIGMSGSLVALIFLRVRFFLTLFACSRGHYGVYKQVSELEKAR